MDTNRKRQKIVALVVSCSLTFVMFLSGCAQYQWQKYGANQSEFNHDKYDCVTEAARTYPTALVTQQITSGYTTASATNCHGTGSASMYGANIYGNNNVNCTTTPGQYVPGITSTVDVNANNRVEVAKACMYARGWQLVRIK